MMEAMEALRNPGMVNPHVRTELADAVRRVLAAGAAPPLTYVGAGLFGIVFCDDHGGAWKAYRSWPRPGWSVQTHITEALEDEFEWLETVMASAAAGNVVRPLGYDMVNGVLHTECVRGRPGHWGDGGRLFEIHKEIEGAMVPLGWNAPEFKEDSYIIRDDGVPILVDVSMVQRLGENLGDYVEQVLRGDRQTHHRWHDLAFFVLREMGAGDLFPGRGRDLLRMLVERDPEIAHSFIIPA